MTKFLITAVFLQSAGCNAFSDTSSNNPTNNSEPDVGRDGGATRLERWDGLLGDIRIFDRALSADENQLYRKGWTPEWPQIGDVESLQ